MMDKVVPLLGPCKRNISNFTLNTPESEETEECEYSILAVMSELSTVRCDRALGLWLQVHGHKVSTESCRGGA